MVSDHVCPPGFFYIAFEFDTKRSVIPTAVHAAIDLAGLKQEPASFAKRYDLLHDSQVIVAQLASNGSVLMHCAFWPCHPRNLAPVRQEDWSDR